MRRRRAGIVVALSLLALTALAGAQTSETVRGEVVGVDPDGNALVVRVPSVDGRMVERTYSVDLLTRIRRGGRTIPLENLTAGGQVVVTYDRTTGGSLARIVDVSGDAQDPIPIGERIDNLEDRRRYQDSVLATLEVLEEEIEELGRSSETTGLTELSRRNQLVFGLRSNLRAATDAYESLVGARSDASWRTARAELQSRMSVLSVALARARSEITGR